jgi:hypothetical protein
MAWYGGITSTNCTFLSQFFGLRLEVLMPFPAASSQYDTLKSQNVVLTLWNIQNPKKSGSTGYFSVRYVNTDAGLVQTSSFGVIAPASKLNFLAGLFQPVLINATNVIVNAATWSTPITLDLTARSKEAVSFTLASTSPDLYFDPPSLLFNSTTSIQSFIVGAPANATTHLLR